jgi:hypothetical protein
MTDIDNDREFSKNFIKEHFKNVKDGFLNDVRNYHQQAKEAQMTNTIKNFFVDLFPKEQEAPTKDDIDFLKLLSHKLNHIPVIDGLEPDYINKFNSIIEKISNMSNNG